jgi:hypothetical protein
MTYADAEQRLRRRRRSPAEVKCTCVTKRLAARQDRRKDDGRNIPEKCLPVAARTFAIARIAIIVLRQSELEFAFAGVSGNTLAEEHL